jgi:hypothetical protein
METIKPLSDIDPRDLPVVERVFGRRIDTTQGMVLILKQVDVQAPPGLGTGGVPEWCNVLDGMSDSDLEEFSADLEVPVRLARPADADGT